MYLELHLIKSFGHYFLLHQLTNNIWTPKSNQIAKELKNLGKLHLIMTKN